MGVYLGNRILDHDTDGRVLRIVDLGWQVQKSAESSLYPNPSVATAPKLVAYSPFVCCTGPTPTANCAQRLRDIGEIAGHF
jgi:hypothetical protein